MSVELRDRGDEEYEYHHKRFIDHVSNCSACKEIMHAPLEDPLNVVPRNKLCKMGKILYDDVIELKKKKKGL